MWFLVLSDGDSNLTEVNLLVILAFAYFMILDYRDNYMYKYISFFVHLALGG